MRQAYRATKILRPGEPAASQTMLLIEQFPEKPPFGQKSTKATERASPASLVSLCLLFICLTVWDQRLNRLVIVDRNETLHTRTSDLN